MHRRQKILLAALLGPALLLGTACGAGDTSRGTGAESAPAGVAPERFRHPGVLVGGAQLEAVRRRVAAGEEPWTSAYKAMGKSAYASLDYTPHPARIVACASNAGTDACVAEREDAIAAYTHALMWSVSGDTAHAAKAVAIMDAWSKTVKEHTRDDADLQTAWSGSSWARAAEIVHAGYPAWGGPAVQRFKWMLRKAYLPAVTSKVPDHNGNWELAMTDAAIGMAVFLEDRTVFEDAVRRYRARVPAYFYLSSDGALPKPPPGGTIDTADELATYWFGQRTYADGLGQETCRNFMHIGYSLAATAHIAETAWHQGVDLYREEAERIGAALEFHARYQLGATAPKWLCGGKVERTMGPDVEVALNHLEGRMGMKLPQTAKLALSQRPGGTDDLFVAWETLTHASNPTPA
ncbi:alginate lyase family protein [Streptomyces sp. SJL17-1]|uniref:alginate lyase family protein n=1 Tax=Streptomyces sp. SJL17-1 TaxID=2967223 RepID=UPI002966DCF0|nr:alginate lyase family protein [Streptomyces sp. SJL17-1]